MPEILQNYLCVCESLVCRESLMSKKKMLLKEEIFIGRSSTNVLMYSLPSYVLRRCLEENLSKLSIVSFIDSIVTVPETQKNTLQMKLDAP